jgi:Fe-Mn family superoxide dismutase
MENRSGMMNFKDLVEVEGYYSVQQLEPLPYEYDALEPIIDEETMREHHTKHLKKYVETYNSLIDGTPASQRTLEEVLSDIRSYGDGIRNNGGGIWNHNFFFRLLTPNKKTPNGNLSLSIGKKWGSMESFIEKFRESGLKRFGSGWVWLVKDIKGELSIITTQNQDNPLMFPNNQYIPIIGCDLWEHSYYLKHKSNRSGWIDSFFECLDWDEAQKNYEG